MSSDKFLSINAFGRYLNFDEYFLYLFFKYLVSKIVPLIIKSESIEDILSIGNRINFALNVVGLSMICFGILFSILAIKGSQP